MDWDLIKDLRTSNYIKRIDYINSIMVQKEFRLLGQGRMRKTYLSPNNRVVLKFPISESGLHSNRYEHNLWHEFKSKPNTWGAYYAPCRIINNTVLMMWFCPEIYGDSFGDIQAINADLLKIAQDRPRPIWVEDLDCCQAGYLYNGKLVAYDFG